jgi:hypothetical protein
MKIEVVVAVDEARMNRRPVGVDRALCPIGGNDVTVRADGDEVTSDNRDSPVAVDRPLAVHGQDVGVAD